MKSFWHNILLSAICWIVNNPGILFFATLLALAAIGHLADVVGEELARLLVVRLAIISVAASAALAALNASLIWRNFDETISRGQRRWMSNLGFFQHQLGYTIVTFVVMMAFYFLLTVSILLLAASFMY